MGHGSNAATSARSKESVPARYWPRVVCHSAEHIALALEVAAQLDLPVTVVSPSADMMYQGPDAFLQTVIQESEEQPTASFRVVIDCGEGVGYAIAVIRRVHHGGIGVDGDLNWSLELEAKENILVKVRDLASLQGLSVDAAIRQAVDIERLKDPRPVLESWLKHSWSAGLKAAANESAASQKQPA